MNALQIEKEVSLCHEAKGIFKGVYPSDELPYFTEKPYSFIANTDGKSLPGVHWVSFYVDSDGIEFFDSYGRSPYSKMFPFSFGEYIKNKQCLYNTRIVEGFFDDTCGNFCIYMTCLRARGITFSEIIDSFSCDSEYNRYIVLNFFK